MHRGSCSDCVIEKNSLIGSCSILCGTELLVHFFSAKLSATSDEAYFLSSTTQLMPDDVRMTYEGVAYHHMPRLAGVIGPS